MDVERDTRRKAMIASLADKQISLYWDGFDIDYQSLARDNGISIVVTNEVPHEIAARRAGRDYVLIPPLHTYHSDAAWYFELAHGLGHGLLRHSPSMSTDQKETGANLYAEQLTGISQR